MPYGGADDKNLPAHVKEMPAKKRAAWVKIWNNAYNRCKEGNGEECEAAAFKVANGMIKKMQLEGEEEGMELEYSPFYVDMAQLTSGKDFDAMVAGSFVDMLGRKVVFKADDLATYVKNTQIAIDATKTESGELVGLPIDAKGHDKGDGAGWIVGISLIDGKVRVTPKWTEVGHELIAKGIRRFFSPTVDVLNKVILGGSLTNWPATRSKKGVVLLRPVELEGDSDVQVIDEAALADESIDQRVSNVRDAFHEKFSPEPKTVNPSHPWVLEVFDKFVILRDADKFYRAEYSIDEKGDVVFAEKPKWQEVKRTWIEAAMQELKGFVARFEAIFRFNQPAANVVADDNQADASTSVSLEQEVIRMDITKEELSAMIADQVKPALVATLKELMQPPAADGTPKPPEASQTFDVLKFFEMEGIGSEFSAAVKGEMIKVYDQAKDKAAQEAAGMIAQIRRESAVADFAHKVTAGTDETPRGLAVESDALKTFLLSLTPDQAAFIQPLLEKVVAGNGVIDFAEKGSAKRQQGQTPLPETYKVKLNSGELKLADLADPILGLGDLSQYDLAAWQK